MFQMRLFYRELDSMGGCVATDVGYGLVFADGLAKRVDELLECWVVLGLDQVDY